MEILKYSKIELFTLMCSPKIGTKLSQDKYKVKGKGQNKHFNSELFLNLPCHSVEGGRFVPAAPSSTGKTVIPWEASPSHPLGPGNQESSARNKFRETRQKL